MQCACPICGFLLAQVPEGLDSRCKCACCGHQCRDCMGREGFKVRSREELERMEEELCAREDNGNNV